MYITAKNNVMNIPVDICLFIIISYSPFFKNFYIKNIFLEGELKDQ